MKTWLIPAAALCALLASPAAFAEPPNQNGPAQQDQHKDQRTNAGAHADQHNQGGSGNATNRGNDNGMTNSSHRTINTHNVVRTRDVIVKRPVVVHRSVVVKRPVEVRRDVKANRHVDVSAFRRNFNAPKRFHANAYHRPSGWYAHRWTYGQRLPRGWYASNYWIGDFLMFGLMAPPDGYVWVRVGDDALLIDEYTGEVVQVVYGIFY